MSENVFEYVLCKTMAISFSLQCVNITTLTVYIANLVLSIPQTEPPG